jgi:hypothetical protein
MAVRHRLEKCDQKYTTNIRSAPNGRYFISVSADPEASTNDRNKDDWEYIIETIFILWPDAHQTCETLSSITWRIR